MQNLRMGTGQDRTDHCLHRTGFLPITGGGFGDVLIIGVGEQYKVETILILF